MISIRFIPPYFIKLLAVLTTLLAMASCRNGPCRCDRPMPGDAISPSATVDAGIGKNNKILVFKYDGSLQCGVTHGVALEAMEKELVGLKVSAHSKRSDGLMHIQVCGQTTGMMNVYEIPEMDLPTAEARGFKKLENN